MERSGVARWCRNAESKMSGKKKHQHTCKQNECQDQDRHTAFHTQLDTTPTKTIISFKQTAMISKKYPASQLDYTDHILERSRGQDGKRGKRKWIGCWEWSVESPTVRESLSLCLDVDLTL